jgi:phospholipase/carboxylesterase
MTGPHDNARIVTYAGGVPAARATRAVILLHGRGGSATDILSLAPIISPPDAVTLAPTASGNTWYPFSFLAPFSQNQQGIDSGHALIESILAKLEADGIPAASTALVGFSQGACLAVDHAFRFPRKYGAIVALTGGLIGPPGTTFTSNGSLDGTPVLLAAGDPDPHVPWERVAESGRVLKAMGGEVSLERYPGAPHAVLPEQAAKAKALLGTIPTATRA